MPAKQPKIYSEWFRGMSTRGKYDLGGFDEIVGCEIHEESGVLRSSFAMENEGGADVTDLIMDVAILPDGTAYGVGNTGRIYKRLLAGGWSYIRSNANGKTVSAEYKDGYVYYASQTKLGRYDVAGDAWNDNWATFSVGATDDPHPIAEVNDQLHIGDGNLIAVVDEGGTFVANGLDLQAYYTITALFSKADNLFFVLKGGGYAHKSRIGWWDTIADSWNWSKPLSERGFVCFIEDVDEVWLVAVSGNVYFFDGSRLRKRKKFRGETPGYNPHVSSNKDGLPLFAGKRGIWAIGAADDEMPTAVHIQYVPSQGEGLDDVGALTCVGDQVLLAWKKGANYGVDKLSANRGNGYVVTPVSFDEPTTVIAKYADLPTGTSISMHTKLNHGNFVSRTLKQNGRRRQYKMEGGFLDISTLQVKVTLNSNGADTPALEYIMLQ
jgi:hypothetical protein